MDHDTIRAAFPTLERQVGGRPLVYLDSAATTLTPRPVVERLCRYYSQEKAAVHRGVHTLADEAGAAYEAARDRVARFLGGQASELVFTHGTTASINLVASAAGETLFEDGGEMLVTAMEHHSNLLPWQRMCARTGAQLVVWPLDPDGALRLDLMDELLTERTGLLAITQVSNVTGVVNPVADICAVARSRGVPVLVDGAQAVPHLPVDVGALGCDFYAFSGHKLYAAHGVGVLWARRKWLEVLPPWQTGGGMVNRVKLDEARWADAPFRFEAGTPPVAAALSLATALDWLDELGLPVLHAHEAAVLHQLERELSGLEGVRVHAPGRARVGAVSFDLAGAHPADVGMILDKQGIAVRTGTHCAEPLVRHLGVSGTIRASLGIHNTDEDVLALLLGLRKAAELLC